MLNKKCVFISYVTIQQKTYEGWKQIYGLKFVTVIWGFLNKTVKLLNIQNVLSCKSNSIRKNTKKFKLIIKNSIY